MNVIIERIEGEQYAMKLLGEPMSEPCSVVKLDHPILGSRVFKIDPRIPENLCCDDFLETIVSRVAALTSLPILPPPPTPKSRKAIKPKKRSLKPSKPLTDEERDLLFGNQSSSSEKPVSTKKTQKKNKSKAPNATRKTKKPTRL